MIKGVIFDMDGLLIDSEFLWYDSMIAVFGKVGLNLTYEKCRQSSGLRTSELVDYWYNKHPFNSLTKEEVINELLDAVIKLFRLKGEKMSGVDSVLKFVHEKEVKTALASSSSLKLIEAVLDKLELKNYFNEVCSAEFEEHGKPHPAIYLKAAKLLDLPVEECLAFEDSFNGVLAAKSAKMKCVCVPDKSQKDDPRFKICDEVLSSLLEFNDELWQRLNK